MKPTRVFLSVQPVSALPKYGCPRPAPRYRASWWTREPLAQLYRSKIVPSKDEAVRLARRWLEKKNEEAAGRSIDTSLIDTTRQPARFGYSHEKKSAAQLNDEITAALREKP